MSSLSPSRPLPPKQGFRLNPWLIRLPVLFITGVFMTLIVLLMFFIAFQMRYQERILPNVSALGMDLSGKTQAEAEVLLANAFDYGQRAVFTLRDGDTFWQFSAADLGLVFNVEETAAAVYALGHSGNLVRDFATQGQIWLEGAKVSPIVTYDQNIALERLNAIAAEINQAPRNASLTINGTAINSVDGQNGRQMDVMATLAVINQRIANLETGTEIALTIHEVSPLVATVSEPTQLIQTALSAPVTLSATDQYGAQLGPWTVSVEQIAQLLRVSVLQAADGSQTYDVSIDMSAFEAYLYTLAPGLIMPAVDGRFSFDMSSGQVQVLQPSVSGRSLNVTETLTRLEQGVFSENRLVPMAFDYNLPRYHNQINAADLGIRELVAESTSYYEGSPQGRRTNIAVSANRVNGVIVAPGEEFSFNYNLGEIDFANDFVESLVIFGGRTVEGVGGGVCQVSTNIFRAAFSGGFAITERNSHGYRVGYYELRGQPAGLDAAIWQPERDFKFQNNTPYHILIEATVYPGDNALQVRFYSTRHWRTEIDAPIIKNIEPAPAARFTVNSDLQAGQLNQVDYAADGADVTIYRRVYDLQGNLAIEDYAYTHYLPWQAIYEVAPGDTRLNQ